MGSKKQPLAANLREIPHTKKHKQTTAGNLPLIQCLGWQVDKTPSFSQRRRLGFHKAESCLGEMGLTSLFETSLHILLIIQKSLWMDTKKNKMLGNFQVRIRQYRKIEQFGGIMLSMPFSRFFPAHILSWNIGKGQWLDPNIFHGLWKQIIRLMVPKSGSPVDMVNNPLFIGF